VEGIPSPCLFGFFRPAIYLNRAAAEKGRLDHILTHELAHHRHGDQWWALVRCACIAAQWFNPLVWAAAWLSRQDCELACDTTAVKILGESERLPYGRTLVGMIAAARLPASMFHTATTMSGTVGSIQERITLIARRPRMTVLTLTCALLTAAVAAGCAFGGAKDSPAQEYLKNNTQEQIFDDFVPATSIMVALEPGFPDAASIPSDDLWGFFTLVGDDRMSVSYDQEKQWDIYQVSASDVRQVLDNYLEGYVFDPTQVSADYDPQTDLFTFPAYSYGSGRTSPAFYQARAVDDDTVEVEISDRYRNNMVVTGRITDDGVRYLSCTTTDYMTYGAEPLSDSKQGAWQLDESTITSDYLTELIASLELGFPSGHVPNSFIFNDPNELTEDQLVKAFLIFGGETAASWAELSAYWDPETERYNIPEEFITQTLHKYFKHFQFDITQDPDYDPDSGCISLATASGLGGDVYLEIPYIKVIGNVVNFTATFYTNSTMQAACEGKRYVVEFYDGGYYFLSATPVLPDYTANYSSLLAMYASDLSDYDNPSNARGTFYDLDGDGSEELFFCYEGPETHVGVDVWTMEGGQAVRLIDHTRLGPMAGSGTGGIQLARYQGKDWLCCWSVNTEARLEGYVSSYGFSCWELVDGVPDPSKDPYCIAMQVDANGEIEDAYGSVDILPIEEYHEVLRCMVLEPVQVLCRLDGEGEPAGLTLDELSQTERTRSGGQTA